MAEISETKTPQAGEYWVSDDGSIIRIVGTKLNGGVIYENQAGFSFQFNSMTNWRHEPRCDSFDWVEPPAESRTLSAAEYNAMLKKLADQNPPPKSWYDGTPEFCVICGAHSVIPGTKACSECAEYAIESPDDWVEITDPEHVIRAIDQVNARGNGDGGWSAAYSSIGSMVKDNEYLIVRCRRKDLPVLVTPEPCAMCGDVSCDCDCYKYAVEATGCPVESPDDWVEITNSDHKLRAGIDEFRNARGWAFVRESHGKTARQAGFLNVRCRRKDLPVPMTRQSVAEVCTSEPVKTPNVVTWGGTVPSAKRVPVRLFLDDRNNMFAIRGEWPIIVGTQIKHDANGFYLEGEE